MALATNRATGSQEINAELIGVPFIVAGIALGLDAVRREHTPTRQWLLLVSAGLLVSSVGSLTLLRSLGEITILRLAAMSMTLFLATLTTAIALRKTLLRNSFHRGLVVSLLVLVGTTFLVRLMAWRLRLREDQRQAVGDVNDVLVSTPQGTVIQAKNLMRVADSVGPSQIQRKNQQRIAYVSAEPEATLSDSVNAVNARLPQIHSILPKDFSIGFGGARR